jgi:hypothetical protein
MFEDIKNYIQRSREDRRAHLNLSEECIEIGGYDSREFRGLLAYHLKTTIPTNVKVVLCHACNNKRCSNVNHLYWGTYVDNKIDLKESGCDSSIWERTISKYGKEEAKRIISQNASVGGKSGGGKNKLTEEQIEEYRNAILSSSPEKIGWVARTAKKLKVSHTTVKRTYEKYLKECIQVYCRKS